MGFVGFGHMAQIIFSAVDRSKLISRSQIQFLRRDRAKMKENEQRYKITATTLETLVHNSDLLILSVRPQQANEVLDQLAAIGGLEGKWIVSILAGVSIEAIAQRLKVPVQIIRVMPNIASAVNEGMSILSFGPRCCPEFQSLTHQLFGAMGEVSELKEELLDIACGMAGSGPGFVIRMIDAVAQAGVKHGIDYSASLKIAAQTFAGAAQLIQQGQMPDDLIAQIATPNGTTQAGLDVMRQKGISEGIEAAIEASALRSRELRL